VNVARRLVDHARPAQCLDDIFGGDVWLPSNNRLAKWIDRELAADASAALFGGNRRPNSRGPPPNPGRRGDSCLGTSDGRRCTAGKRRESLVCRGSPPGQGPNPP
jgi:hypothetical protein